MHNDWDIFGYRIGKFAYITDCSSIPEETISKMQNLDLLVLDALRVTPHNAHLSVQQAIEVAKNLKSKRTILTHMSSDLDYYELMEILPEGIEPGYDGLSVEL